MPAFSARFRPKAPLRLEITRTMEEFGRRLEEHASMRAWRLVPLPEIRTIRREGAGSGSGDAMAVVVNGENERLVGGVVLTKSKH